METQWSEGALDTQLVVSQGPASFLDTATVVDDTPLWIAWEAAQTAWLESKRRRSGGENTVRAYALAVKQFFGWAFVSPWQVSPGHAQEWAVHLSTDAKQLVKHLFTPLSNRMK